MSDWKHHVADQNQRMAAKMLEQQGEINRLKAENADLNALFTMQYTRMTEATALWQAEAPEERKGVLPDLGALLTWLMERKT